MALGAMTVDVGADYPGLDQVNVLDRTVEAPVHSFASDGDTSVGAVTPEKPW